MFESVQRLNQFLQAIPKIIPKRNPKTMFETIQLLNQLLKEVPKTSPKNNS